MAPRTRQSGSRLSHGERRSPADATIRLGGGVMAPIEIPEDIARRLAAARRVVAFTGAGVSKESGLDTFRDAGGVWQRVRPEDLATPQAFRRQPATVWQWYAARWRTASAAVPNLGHLALAR